jgi:catechol 2,3-dioxygenase-like lactoylglutathione lyase family enzyme
MITVMNHAVLYARDAHRQRQFYTGVLGCETVVEDLDGAFVFMRAPGSAQEEVTA